MKNVYRTGLVSLAVLLVVGVGLYAAAQAKAPERQVSRVNLKEGPTGNVSVIVTTRMSSTPIPIAGRVGSQIVITIPSNQTTGFKWGLGNKPGAAVKLVGSAYAAPSNGLAGQGGMESWTFRAVAPGSAAVSMEYARTWEKKKGPVKKQAFSVTVQ